MNSVNGQVWEIIRTTNPETSGGLIALIATDQMIMQEPPHSLERMHAADQKQVIIHLLGLAPAGYLAARDKGP
jgi:hypothetical protein